MPSNPLALVVPLGAALAVAALSAACGGASEPLAEGQGEMSFFVVSRNMGAGGDLGGLAGADAHCRELARAAGSSFEQWRAYLSVSSGPLGAAVNARDRIGPGPWFNAKGVRIAADWTSRSSNDRTMLGHNDKRGGGSNPRSWNSAHMSQGCSPASLQATGGDARFYCFATATPSGVDR